VGEGAAFRRNAAGEGATSQMMPYSIENHAEIAMDFVIDGRNVEISGIIVMDGRAISQMNDARQLRVKS